MTGYVAQPGKAQPGHFQPGLAGLVPAAPPVAPVVALAPVQPIASNIGVGPTSLTVTLSQPTTAGNCLVVNIMSFGLTTNPTIVGVTLGGSAGNFAQVNTAGNTGDTAILATWADPNCAGGQTTVTITFTGGAGRLSFLAEVLEFSGIVPSSPADRTGFQVATNNTTTTWFAGGTAVTQQPLEVAIGFVGAYLAAGITGVLFPQSLPWSTYPQVTSGNGTEGLLTGYRYVYPAATASYQGGFTTSGVHYVGLVTTFKAAAGVIAPANQWKGSLTGGAGYIIQPPANKSLQVAVANTGNAGNWLVAFCSWRQPPGYQTTVAVGDDAGNVWEPLGAPVGTSPPNGLVRSAIWVCASPAAATNVFMAPTAYAISQTMLVVEFTGLSPWQTLAGVDTEYSPAAFGGTSNAVYLPPPPAQAITFACGGSDNNTLTVTGPTNGQGVVWPTTWFPITVSNGADQTQDLKLLPAWQLTPATASVQAAWQSSGAIDQGACLASVLVVGTPPAVNNPNWPVFRMQTAFGAGAQTPWDMLQWTDITPRWRGLQGQRGKQYELDTVQAGTFNWTLSNNDGALTVGNVNGAYYQPVSAQWPVLLGIRTAQINDRYSWNGQLSTMVTCDGSTPNTLIGGPQFPVAPGQVVKVRGALICPQGWPSQVQFKIVWWDANGGFLGQSTQTSTPPPGTWVLNAVEGTAIPGTFFSSVQVVFFGTPQTSVQFFLSPMVAFTPGVGILTPNYLYQQGPQVFQPCRLLGSWPPPPSAAARTYSVARGFMERWPQSLSQSRYQSTNSTAVDVWALLTTLMQNIARCEMEADQPYAYWPMDDPAGSTQAACASGPAGPLQIRTSKYGAGAATYSFGATQSGNQWAGNQGATFFQVVNTSASSTLQGYALYYTDPNMPSLANGVTIEGWFTSNATQPAGLTNIPIFIVNTPSTGGAVVFRMATATGNLFLDLYDKVTHAVTTFTISTGNWLGGTLFFSLELTLTTWKAFLNAGSFATVTGSGACNLGAGNWWFECGGQADQISTGGFSNFSVLHLAIYPRLLTQGRIVSHYIGAGLAFHTEDDPGQRMDRLLGDGNAAFPRVLPATTTMAVIGAVDVQGNAVSQNLVNIAETDGGLLFVNRAGYIQLLERLNGWNLGITQTLGESTGGPAAWQSEAHAADGTGLLTSLACSKPAGTQMGDLLVAVINVGNGAIAGLAAPPGWTQFVPAWQDSLDSGGAAWYKVASAPEPSSYTFSWTVASQVALSIQRISGANTANPIRAWHRDAAGHTGASFTSTVLTGTQAGDLIVACGIDGDDSAVTGATITPPSSPWTTADSFPTPFVVQHAPGTIGGAASGTITLPNPTTPGNTVIVCLSYYVAGGSISDNAVTLGGAAGNFARRVSNQTFAPYNSIWEDFNCAGGQTVVGVTLSVPGYAAVDVYEVSGLLSTGAFDQQAHTGANSTTPSSGATPATAQSSEFVVGVMCSQGGALAATAAGFTEEAAQAWFTGGVYNHVSGYQIAAATGTFTYSGTQSPAFGWGASVATFKAAVTAYKYQANSWLAGPQGSATATFQSSSSTAVWDILTYAVAAAGNGEIPYGADITIDCDPSQVYDDVTLTQVAFPATGFGPAQPGTTVKAVSPARIARFGDQTLQQTVYMNDVGLETDLANWILQTSAPPVNRVSQVVLDAKANPALWPLVLGVEVGQVWTFNRRLGGTQLEISEAVQVLSIAPNLSPTSGQITLGLVPYYGLVLSADDPVRGLTDGTHALGW